MLSERNSAIFRFEHFLFASRGISIGFSDTIIIILVFLLREQEISEMEQNETGCQAPQAPMLCVNNCGFFGTAATMNMCSKCYKDHAMKQEQANLAASSIQSIVNGSTGTVEKGSDVSAIIETKTTLSDTKVLASPENSSAASLKIEEPEEIKSGPKRCSACKKRVGLTGFNCRCGNIFCSVHRYSDKHKCPYDYRSAGQEAISKANPVVKAEKLDKI